MNTYDIVTIQITTMGDQVISILPTTGKINFFCITSDQYGKKDQPLKYTISPNDPAIEDNNIELDRPHVLIGESVLKKMGDFSTITFNNKTGSEANVRVFVGRNV